MSRIPKIINQTEKLISLKRPHWIYLLEGVFWLLILTILGFVIDHFLYQYAGSRIGANPLLLDVDLWFVKFDEDNTPIPWIFAFTGAAIFWPYFLIYISQEIALTDQRIIHKKGLIFVTIDQVDLEDIRAEHVYHGLLGWFIGYGSIRLDCRFIDDVHLPAINHPYQMVKASHNARLKHPLIDYDLDEFHTNIESIETKRQEMQRKEKLRRLKQKMKMNFRKAK
tara:strand:+ start:1355 stop:2026 length:672 start_codon:yes stop_codon:yes gene_type:complete